MGKTIHSVTRILKVGGGSAAPGLYALKLDPNLVENLTSKVSKNVIITGTNGKTTTARLLTHSAKAENLTVIRNATGSNLERGIASALIGSISVKTFFDKKTNHYDLGIWEIDEAAFNVLAPKIKSEAIIFLNVFRDQLDRYGEVDTVVSRWHQTLKNLPYKTTLIVNGDDGKLTSLKDIHSGQVQFFGLESQKIKTEAKAAKVKLELAAQDITSRGLDGTTFSISVNQKRLTVNLPVPGFYHIYDFLAAFNAGLKLGFDPAIMISSLKDFSPAFGRVEKVKLGNNDGYLFLIKNPIGATQVFETVMPNLKNNDRLFLALNDNFADGTDVSWIWDAEFEKLAATNSQLWIVSGTRAYDLANRLKYAGIKTEKIKVIPNLPDGLKHARLNLEGRLFMLPTYTAMLELQKIFSKLGIKKNYWEEV